MNSFRCHGCFAGRVQRAVSLLLAMVMAGGPSVSAWAQGFGAIQSTRKSVSGLQQVAPEASPVEAAPTPEQPQPAEMPPPPGYSVPTTGATGVGINTAFVPGTASLVLAIRPAQVLNSPLAKMFPVEVASAAGLKYMGIDPADVEEVVMFADMTKPIPLPSELPIPLPGAPSYGVMVRFTNPFRASALSPSIRPAVQLADFNGKKYWQSTQPLLPSFYGADNRTLIAAPDKFLQEIVLASTQPKSGPIIDRVRNTPAGNDFYLAVEMEKLRPLLQIAASFSGPETSPQAKQALEVANLVSAIELTLNPISSGPTEYVLHATDEASAQQLEGILQALVQSPQMAMEAAGPALDDPILQALEKYQQRVWLPFQQVSREGTKITWFRMEALDPLERQQKLTSAVFGSVVAMLLPAIQAAREAARRAQAGAAAGGQPPGPGESFEFTPQQ